MLNVTKIFGENVFDDSVMKERLPANIYKAVRKTITEGTSLNIEVANVVASAMKDWAIEKGCTHYTHWFQPMTGITAEKHDSFIEPTKDGHIIMDFSGKALIKGEPDASSFPSGGLRSTFEARGYTAWDPTSYAFVKDGSLCIPTAFCAYTGEILDKKTPLLRSMEAINIQALRILRLFGNTEAKRVITTVGPEQEYFLVDKEYYNKRKDLTITGRTLFGAMPPKGQEMNDHYFGAIKTRVSAFMKELDEKLWELGILAKTKHNEAAPAQHELAPIFTVGNTATDHNQLTMEFMKKIAEKHSLVCLLHEKPFKGVNGSGKHNNWALATDKGDNLFKPGKEPHNNLQFLTFLCAVIKAVDEYQDLLRISVASAGNDHRLGAHEAPPAIVSIFLGSDLEGVLDSLEKEAEYTKEEKKEMTMGVDAVPLFTMDTADRNRTSPFAFTGNKFEFRMLGSSDSIACTNVMLNTAVAEVLKTFADELEGKKDFETALKELLRNTYKNHKRIIFNGNNYSEEWVKEAERRGLSNLRSTADALPLYPSERYVELFKSHGVYTHTEVKSRCEILLENYSKTINIEAKTMLDMTKRDILPAISKYTGVLAESILNKKSVLKNATFKAEEEILSTLANLTEEIYSAMITLEQNLDNAPEITGTKEVAKYFEEKVLRNMEILRTPVDKAETLCSSEYWPMPTYEKLFFGV